MIVGIDLGTTNSLVAVMDGTAPRLIPNSLGEWLTPSVVGIDEDGGLLVGGTAKEYQVLHPEACVGLFKRSMGVNWTCTLGGRKFTAVELSSLVLRSLKEDAEAELKHPIDRAVITVPAYFNDDQRRATMRAAELVGLKAVRIINEPTAAAIAYGMQDSESEKVMCVVDLGGGTFDVSVLEIFDGTLEIRASAGETFLGGEDFTTALTRWVLGERGIVFERAEMETPTLVSRLRKECETAKRTLTSQESATLRIPNEAGEFNDDSPVVIVTREQFADCTQRILERIDIPIRRALGDAKVKRADIHDVLLVGGATRMRSFIDRVMELLGQPPRCGINPDHVVALGAAIQAALIEQNKAVDDLVVTDVAPFTLGVDSCRIIGSEEKSGYFFPIITRNTTIPTSRTRRVGTMHANQTVVRIAVYQGEGRMVEQNLSLGEFMLEGIPKGPAGQAVDIRFSYDLNGVLEVEATIVATQKKATLVISRHAKGMSEAEIRKAVADMQALKSSPREEAVNRHLLMRAERLYQELPISERDRLDDLLTGFESALEENDTAAIALFRSELEQFLNLFDRGANDADHDGEHWT
ncbi:MAG: Hsp70 family protein [Planctomycetaceae bacterium]